MIKFLLNFARGMVEVEIISAYKERFLNICSKNDIFFWNIRLIDDATLHLKMRLSDYRRAKPLAEKSMCTLRLCSSRGVPVLWKSYKKRYTFWAGIVLLIAMIASLNTFIWTVEIEGNTDIKTETILAHLDALGVHKGALKNSVDVTWVQEGLRLSLKDLAFVAVNISGSSAKIIVREQTKIPNIVEKNAICDIIANETGLITTLNVFNGASLVTVGQIVFKGDRLVSGEIQSAMGETRFVRSDAQITARTWVNEDILMPKTAYKKELTGLIRRRLYVTFFKSRIPLYRNGDRPFPYADKSLAEYTPVLLGVRLPLSFGMITYRDALYTEIDVQANDVAAYMKKEAAARFLQGKPDARQTYEYFTINDFGTYIKANYQGEYEEEIACAIEIQAIPRAPKIEQEE